MTAAEINNELLRDSPLRGKRSSRDEQDDIRKRDNNNSKEDPLTSVLHQDPTLNKRPQAGTLT
jgi:hypothetical protein